MKHPLEPGIRVAGRFVVSQLLGVGGLGVVYRARQESLDRDVALKIIRPEHASNETVRQRFVREARVAASLVHRNAVEIYDFGEHEDTCFLAMELLRGDTLRARVDVGLPPLPVRASCTIARQIADVLVAARELDLVHRDLKPENVMMEPEGEASERAVVVDFGLAFRLDHTPETGRVTKDGMASGTPDYMAPEQVRGAPSTPATDVYALGSILYEMLTSNAPLATPNPALTLTRQLFTQAIPMREAFPHLSIPAELDELTLGMLRKDARERPEAIVVRDVLRRFEIGARERTGTANEEGRSLGRQGRMLSELETQPILTPILETMTDGARVGVVGGTLDLEVETALFSQGLTLASEGEEPDVWLVLGRDVERVREYVAAGRAVVAEVDSSDAEQITAMSRAGALDVVPAPLDGALLVRRIERAIRKAARRA